MNGADGCAVEQVVVVSDLHMGAGDDRELFTGDREFVGFCHHLAERPPQQPGSRRLVVLGDFLELLGVRAGIESRRSSTPPIALARLERIANAHAEVFAALGQLVRRGWQLDIVVGNHDIELVRPVVQDRVRGLLGGDPAGLVRFHPWILHVPGILYAEHGHQYHDINWFKQLVWAAGKLAADPVTHPPAAYLGERRLASIFEAAREVALRVLGVHDPRRRCYRREALGNLSAGLGLDAELLREIDLLPEVATGTMLLRLALQAPRVHRSSPPYLYEAAENVHAVLQRAGVGCAFYAFGHSHIAERRPLPPAGTVATYLNAGTWCREVRGSLRFAAEDSQRTYVVIDCAAAAGPTATLHAWGRRGVVPASLDNP